MLSWINYQIFRLGCFTFGPKWGLKMMRRKLSKLRFDINFQDSDYISTAVQIRNFQASFWDQYGSRIEFICSRAGRTDRHSEIWKELIGLEGRCNRYYTSTASGQEITEEEVYLGGTHGLHWKSVAFWREYGQGKTGEILRSQVKFQTEKFVKNLTILIQAT